MTNLLDCCCYCSVLSQVSPNTKSRKTKVHSRKNNEKKRGGEKKIVCKDLRFMTMVIGLDIA